MSKKVFTVLAIVLIATMALAACGSNAGEGKKVCQVSDVGGIDDKSFNAFAWKGMQDAEDEFGVEIVFVESQQQTDYEININTFLEDECDLIITVGFMLGDPTIAAAGQNPDQMFAGIDQWYGEMDNIRSSFYNIHEGTFLLGYLSAGMTETGKVGTYGGINIPPVTAFMDGFVLGVEYYNQQNGTSVEVLGWDMATGEGLFTGNFESTDDGRAMGVTLLDEGADIIMPVAGPVGAGTLAVLEERDFGLLVGVDTDWSSPEGYADQADYILASAMKRMDLFVFDTIEMYLDDLFVGEQYIANLENGRVGLAYGSAWEDQIPDDLKAEIEEIQQMIIDGEISAAP